MFLNIIGLLIEFQLQPFSSFSWTEVENVA